MSKILDRLRDLPVTAEQLRRQQDRDRAKSVAQAPDVVVFDSAGFADSEVKNDAGSVVQVWAGTSAADLEEGETLIDRLIGMLVEMAAPESSDDEPLSGGQEEMATTYMHAAAAYMVSKGAAEGDVVAMFDGDDAEAAARVHEFLSGEFTGDDADMDDLHKFAFQDGEQAAVFDSIGVLDAVYKNTAVVRNGKKLMLKRRVSGTVRRSGAQKIAIKRAQMRSRSSAAKLKRAKSMRVRMKMGL
jgi:hypothetical protein